MLRSPIWDLLDSPVLVGDCIETMAELPEASVDAVVCDPPYGIGFMGKEWDGAAIAAAAQKDRETRKSLGPESPSRPGRAQPRSSSAFGNEAIIAGPVRGGIDFQHWCESWAREALRILKPGGHLLAFGGTRTYHRMAAGIEDAGFEIRDSIMWLYGSGFPKSLDVSKAIDKAAGAEREDLGESTTHHGGGTNNVYAQDEWTKENFAKKARITAPATPEAAQWEGWGTALKPAHEPIVVARKPLIGTVAANILEFRTGGINVGGCRLEPGDGGDRSGEASAEKVYTNGIGGADKFTLLPGPRGAHAAGRWPANVVLSHLEGCGQPGECHCSYDLLLSQAEAKQHIERCPYHGSEPAGCAPGCPVAALDAQTGELKSGFLAAGTEREGIGYRGRLGNRVQNDTHAAAGAASRFFYCAKTSRAERNAGLEGFEEKDPQERGSTSKHSEKAGSLSGPRANHHPTVKPINLMRWLVRLVTPPGGLILDPFLGSGSTGCAAVLEGFDFIGIEREAEYAAIAEARIVFWAQHTGREVEDVLGLHATSQKQAKAHADRGQVSIDDLLPDPSIHKAAPRGAA